MPAPTGKNATIVHSEGDLTVWAASAFSDNYVWLIGLGDEWLAAVDPGDCAQAAAFLESRGDLAWREIWVTHAHDDHTRDALKLKTIAEGLNARRLGQAAAPVAMRADPALRWDDGDASFSSERRLPLGFRATMAPTPGHTLHSVSHILTEPGPNGRKHVFCGDALFAAGAGRIFTGTLKQAFESFRFFASLDDRDLLYPAHEYTRNNLRFALEIEPGNKEIEKRLDSLSVPSLPTTAGLEKRTNPFLRCSQDSVRAGLIERGAIERTASDLEVFAALRRLKDDWR